MAKPNQKSGENYTGDAAYLKTISKNLGILNQNVGKLTKSISESSQVSARNSSPFVAVGSAMMAQELAQVADEIGGGFGYMVGSSGGIEDGVVASSALSSGISLAVAGAMMGGGIPGAIAGGVFGVISGAFAGRLQNQEKKDQVFRTLVQNQYENTIKEQEENIRSGTQLAALREQEILGLLGGGGEFGEAQKALEGYGDREVGLGFTGSELGEILGTLDKIRQSSQADAETLRSFYIQGTPAMRYLSQGLGKDQEEVARMLEEGSLSGEDASQAISRAMGENLTGESYLGLWNTVQALQQEIQTSGGEGYIKKRKEDLEDEALWLSGEDGEKLKEAYSLMGQWQATLENDHEEAVRKALEDAMKEEDYLEAIEKGNGAEAGKILAVAKTKAESEYRKGDDYQLYMQTQKDIVGDMREELGENWMDFGYNMALEFSKGLMAAKSYIASSLPPADLEQMGFIYDETNPDGPMISPSENPLSAHYGDSNFAYGLQRVPYDNFPAILHEGERVLTAAEARGYAGETPRVSVSGNNFYVREEQDIYRIAEAVAARVAMAVEVMA